MDGAYFSTAGVPAAVGRTIRPSDAVERVVVLSHGLWRARFGADPAIVGGTVRISGRPFEVIGIAPASFEGASGAVPGTKLWIPLGTEASIMPPSSTAPRDRRRLLVFGRLAQSVTTPMASAELRAIAARLDTAFPPRVRGSQAGPTERPWRAKSIADITAEDSILRRFGLALVTLVALVLVVACTNLANLVLARGTTRQQEFAIRRALGASRGASSAHSARRACSSRSSVASRRMSYSSACAW